VEKADWGSPGAIPEQFHFVERNISYADAFNAVYVQAI
jgi:hypothetical protein